MGGFVAILDTSGAPVDRRLLLTMLDVAPHDRSRAVAWTGDNVGLGGAPLRSPHPVEAPLSVNLHDRLSIVMDGRLDDRAALVRQLEADLECCLGAVSDAELALAAYKRWGTDCAAHLLGDFSFCVWDGERRQLVCARDHFGVKPLYHARVGPAVVISNVLRSVRRHPGVSVRLDDLAVGDVLLFGLAMDPSRTMFADVSRLAPAHVLVWPGSGGHRVHRYWALEPPPTHDYRDRAGPVEEFAAALRRAVADRVRGGPVGVLMSGGLDSSSVTAVAADVLGPSAPESLCAFTGIYETVAADEERYYSSLVAARLNIRIDHLPLDGYTFFDRWDNGGLPPEPTTEPMTATTADLLSRAAHHGASVLTGDGGDPLLLPSPLISQIGNVPFGRLMAGLWTSLRAEARPPIGLRSSLRRYVRPSARSLPSWLAEPLLRSFDARRRWAEITAQRSADRGPRSAAVNRLTDPWWPSTFETYDPGATGRPVDMRYPFFDVRLVDVALRLPSFPFCVNKQVLRSAMRGSLPDAVVQRPKTPLAVAPEAFHSRWSLSAAVQTLAAVPAIGQYVNVQKFAAAVRPELLFTDRAPGTLAAVSLAMWLRHSAAPAEST
jgi:asparagine synthase (glutamine-hydrolysing)